MNYLKREDTLPENVLSTKVIRLRPNEFNYACALKAGDLLTHFNLQNCENRVGTIYLMPQIKEPGYYTQTGGEVLPKLDFTGCPVAECVSSRWHCEYDELKASDFDFSYPDLIGIKSLQRDILLRYSESMPDLTEEQLLRMGVSVTTVRVLGHLK